MGPRRPTCQGPRGTRPRRLGLPRGAKRPSARSCASTFPPSVHRSPLGPVLVRGTTRRRQHRRQPHQSNRMVAPRLVPRSGHVGRALRAGTPKDPRTPRRRHRPTSCPFPGRRRTRTPIRPTSTMDRLHRTPRPQVDADHGSLRRTPGSHRRPSRTKPPRESVRRVSADRRRLPRRTQRPPTGSVFHHTRRTRRPPGSRRIRQHRKIRRSTRRTLPNIPPRRTTRRVPVPVTPCPRAGRAAARNVGASDRIGSDPTHGRTPRITAVRNAGCATSSGLRDLRSH